MSKQLHSYEGMTLVKEQYSESKLSDTDFSALASEKLGRKYSVAHIRQYRQVLNIPNNSGPAKSAPSVVYVVTDQGEGQTRLLGVFSTEDKAQALCESYEFATNLDKMEVL